MFFFKQGEEKQSEVTADARKGQIMREKGYLYLLSHFPDLSMFSGLLVKLRSYPELVQTHQ